MHDQEIHHLSLFNQLIHMMVAYLAALYHWIDALQWILSNHCFFHIASRATAV